MYFCKLCNSELSLDNNWTNSRAKKNIQVCRSCDNARRSQYRCNDVEKSRIDYTMAGELRRTRYIDYKEKAKVYISTNKNLYPEKYILRLAKHRAKIKGVPFSISVEDIQIPEYCPILNILLIMNGGRNNPASPSLDRIIPELGYVCGNIAVISNRANTIKNNATLDELESIVDWLKDKIS